MRKFIILLCILAFSVFPLIAEPWFVCLGSFTIEDNAQKFVQVLKNKGFDADIDKREIKGTLYYRVLLLLDFEDVESARKKRDVLLTQEGIVALRLKDLWVCVPSDEFYQEYQHDKVAHHLLEKPIVLQENTDIPVSEEKPYSVVVGKYREESVAEHTKDRLKKDGLDAYVVKTYDEKEYFSFDVNVSAFASEEEAEALINQLEEKGINAEGISNYNDVKESIRNYNDIVKNKHVNQFLGNAEIPTVFSPAMQASIKEFPINKDFQIESIHIFDLENIRSFPNSIVELDIIEDMLINEEETNIATIAYYKDNLFNKNISILLQKGKNGAYKIEQEDGDESLKLHTTSGDISCVLREDEGYLYLLGTNEEGSTFVKMKSDSFSKTEFDIFLNNISNDSSLLVYPEIRRSLLVLPQENKECKRDFLWFELTKVPPSYAEERGYVDWAIPIVGHWKSTGVFNANDESVSVSFFDMDYDYNASSVHGMFMKKRKGSGISASNKPITLKKLEGWLSGANAFRVGNEVSFSCKSYIIAINSYTNSFDTGELVRLGDDLQIWE